MLKLIKKLSKSSINDFDHIANYLENDKAVDSNHTKATNGFATARPKTKLTFTQSIGLKVAEKACTKLVQWLDKSEQQELERMRAAIASKKQN